jgi:hypothetical protein
MWNTDMECGLSILPWWNVEQGGIIRLYNHGDQMSFVYLRRRIMKWMEQSYQSGLTNGALNCALYAIIVALVRV